MKLLPWVLSLVLSLATAYPAQANLAAQVWKDDPGYTQARVASVVAPVFTVAAILLTVFWSVRSRSAIRLILVLAFCLLVWILHDNSNPTPTLFESDPAPPGWLDPHPHAPFAKTDERQTVTRIPPGSTPEESVLLDTFLAVVLCFGVPVGLRWMWMRFTARETPIAPAHSSPNP